MPPVYREREVGCVSPHLVRRSDGRNCPARQDNMTEMPTPSVARPSRSPIAEVPNQPRPDFRPIDVPGSITPAVVAVHVDKAIGVLLPVLPQKGVNRVIGRRLKSTISE